LVTVASKFSVRETIDLLKNAVTSAGLSVFTRIDHASNAEQVGMKLRPTELLIFGNAKGITPLMLDQQTAGIDLPFKALAWEDGEGKVWLTSNAATWLATRHELEERSKALIETIEGGLGKLIQAATAGAAMSKS
jgi:uncharacterized protein (DUF302 family)